MRQLPQRRRVNDTDPQDWLTSSLTQVADQPNSRVAELAPWNFRQQLRQGRPRRTLTCPAGRSFLLPDARGTDQHTRRPGKRLPLTRIPAFLPGRGRLSQRG
ncbi:transposase domain-containing protein [Hyphomonas sp.]|uniref:transposase domain-containing protein n=1 Tax=Hyphomonas sp. TaxID=87 RepID=UPI00391DA372